MGAKTKFVLLLILAIELGYLYYNPDFIEGVYGVVSAVAVVFLTGYLGGRFDSPAPYGGRAVLG